MTNNNDNDDKKKRPVNSRESMKWDLDGDGMLDEAELALKNMAHGEATISNEELYKLMQDHLAAQKSVWQWKKISFASFALIILLALSTFGTSLAAAFLAKDTATS